MKISTSSTADDIRHHADGAEQNQAVVFPGADLLHFHVLERSEDDDQSRSAATRKWKKTLKVSTCTMFQKRQAR